MISKQIVFGLFFFWSCQAFGSTTVYETGPATGFFTPFSQSSIPGTLYGDSGWVTGFGSPPVVNVDSITLGLAVFATTPTGPGNTDLVFTFNDGDPSGLVFGTGAQLYSTTLSNVTLPDADGVDPTYFSITIPLPNLALAGNFNNLGWSLGVSNFQYGGSFGFQNHGDFNVLGFYTNNASQFTPGSGWSLFSFGPNDPQDIANFVATVTVVPEPGWSLGFASMLACFIRKRSSIV